VVLLFNYLSIDTDLCFWKNCLLYPRITVSVTSTSSVGDPWIMIPSMQAFLEFFITCQHCFSILFRYISVWIGSTLALGCRWVWGWTSTLRDPKLMIPISTQVLFQLLSRATSALRYLDRTNTRRQVAIFRGVFTVKCEDGIALFWFYFNISAQQSLWDLWNVSRSALSKFQWLLFKTNLHYCNV